MAEQIPEMETIAEKGELKHEVADARFYIEQAMRDPAQQTTDAAGEVGLAKALLNTMQSRNGKYKELLWKDFKAQAAGVVSVIPLVGEAGTLAKLGSAAEAGKTALSAEKAFTSTSMIGDVGDAALSLRNSSRSEFWKALKNVPRNPAHLVSEPLKSGKEVWNARKGIREVGKTADQVARLGEVGVLGGDPSRLEATLAEKMGDAEKAYSGAKKQFGKDVLIGTGLHLMHKFDPFPDVPSALTTVAGLAEFVLPGANILPAVWQLAHNKIEWTKMYGGLALDMGKVVMKRMDGKFNEAKKPDVMAAAATFV